MVTDFGLAKRLEGGTTGTQTGVILGTPGYMAPEQAAGRSRDIGPATDTYALGAILYEMLIGRPPFQGETPLETVQQVREGEVVPPRRLRPAVPRDLETICLKCLQQEPGRRYAGAQALADDLQRFLRGEPVLARPVGAWERGLKWARRRPLAAALALVSLLAVGGLLVGTVWIDEARRRADREAAEARLQEQKARDNYERAENSYRLARASMAGVLAEIRQDPRFQEGPLEGVRKLLLQAELKFYEQFAVQRGEEPAFKAEQGEAYLNLGRITQDLEGEDKALAAYRQAVARFAELARNYPANPDYRAKLAESYFWLGKAHDLAGRFGEAEQAFGEALALVKPLTAQKPQDSRSQSQTANVLNNLGILYADKRRFPDAVRTWSEASAILKALMDRHPENPDYASSLAECRTNLAKVYAETGRLREAIQARQQALEIVKGLAERHTPNLRYTYYVGIFSVNLGLLYQIARRLPEAEQAFQDALAILKPLADQHPLVREYARGLALVQMVRGDFVRDTGTVEDALPWYTEAVAGLEAVAGKAPKETSVRWLLRDAYVGRARALDRLGRPGEALPDWERALELETGKLVPSLRLNRACALARLGEHVRATAEADAVANGDQVSSVNLYNAGVVYALSAAAVSEEPSLKEHYAARAVGLLRRAVRDGFPYVGRLRTEPMLEAVRGRTDFQELLGELAESRKSSDGAPARD